MKKLFIAFVALMMASSCSVDDDSANTTYELAEITGHDLPKNFVFGETYTVKINYILPSQCNNFALIDARTGGSINPEKREIYVGIVTSLNNSSNCDATVIGEDGSKTFSITIDETEAYTFYFWTGLDEDDQPIYTEIIIPVEEALSSDN